MKKINCLVFRSSSMSFIKKNSNLIFLSIIILGLILRLFGLSAKSLWGDEFITLEVAEKGINYILTDRITTLEPHNPPGYHIFNYFLIKYLGKSTFIIRLPSVIFGALAILITYRLSYRILGLKGALLGSFLISISPLHIFYSQFARPYAIFITLSLISLLCFYEILKDGGKNVWLGFIFSNILNIYTHFYAFFIIIAEMLLFFALRKKSYPFNKFLFSLGAIAISCIPLVYLTVTYVPTHLGSVAGWNAPPSLTWLPHIFYKFSIGLRRMEAVDWRLIAGISFPVFAYAFLRGIYVIMKGYKTEGYLLILYMFLPIVSSFVFSQILFPIFNFRYFTFALPVYLVFITAGILNMNRKINYAIIIGICILYIYLLYDYYFLIDKNDWYLSVGL